MEGKSTTTLGGSGEGGSRGVNAKAVRFGKKTSSMLNVFYKILERQIVQEHKAPRTMRFCSLRGLGACRSWIGGTALVGVAGLELFDWSD